jgi:hypothetical protein
MFWPAVLTIYAGFLVLAADALFEPRLNKWWKTSAIIIISVLTCTFSWYFVFFRAPISITAMITDAAYPTGTQIAGIYFRPEFTELRLFVKNPSSRNYNNLNLIVQPSAAIAAIAQASNIPNVSFDDKNGLSTRVMEFDPAVGKAIVAPLTLLATDVGYRIHCDKLSADEVMTVVIALADVRWNPSAAPTQRPPGEVIRDKDYVMRIKNE